MPKHCIAELQVGGAAPRDLKGSQLGGFRVAGLGFRA